MVPNVQDPFWRAVAAVRRLPPDNVDDNLKLEFYALFKQATKGDVVDARRGVVGRRRERRRVPRGGARAGSTSAVCKTHCLGVLRARVSDAVGAGSSQAPPAAQPAR